MKKKLLFLFAFVIAAFAVYVSLNKDSEIEKERKQYAKFIKNNPYNKTLQLTKKERKAKGLPPNKYLEQEYLLEMNPSTGRTHPENVFRIQQELKSQRKLQRVPGDATDNMWVERGPNNVGGRTRVVMFDPNDVTHKRVFAGGVSGGLWVNNDITDANSSWTRVGIDENLSISCMTVDPNNSQIMYVGTGEVFTNAKVTGNGIWKSTDGGNSWVNVFNNTNESDYQRRTFFINDIIAWNNPVTNKTEVFIGLGGAYYANAGASTGNEFPSAYSVGLFKSVDNQDVWNRVTMPDTPESTANTYGALYEPNDFEIGPDNTLWVATKSTIFSNNKSGGTILKSTDGTNFTVAHTIANGARTEIAVSKINKDKIYVLCNVSGEPKILSTTNGFTSTTDITGPADADPGISNSDFTRGQAFYDLVIEVDPTHDNIIYVGGVDLFRSNNAGATWQQISKWHSGSSSQQYFYDSNLPIPTVHADQHGWAFHPTDPNKAILSNDGGVYYAASLSDAATTTTAIEVRNKDYNVTQFYNGAIAQSTTNEILLAGAQDNGTQFVGNAQAGINGTTDVRGGDGAYSFIDKDGNYMIVSYVYNDQTRIKLPYTGNSNDRIKIDDNLNAGSFINPKELDDNLDILYTNYSKTESGNRSYALAKFSNLSTTPVKTEFTNALLTGEPTVLKVSPFTTTSTKLFVGTNDGKLFKITNADKVTPIWNEITGGSFVGSISAIAFGATENDILVTFHNYGVVSIWSSDDGGTTWKSKEGNFPDIPVKAIMMNPLNNNEVIIGTQLGVWRTSNFYESNPFKPISWSQSFNGMSNVKVTSFSLRTADNTVMATSYGRGIFTGQFATGVASVEDVVKDSKVFTMYPTVSNGEFTIFAKNTLGKANLLMFDINGKQVFSKQIDFTQQEKQPISVNLTSGVYIVNLIDTNNIKSTGKVIIK